MPRQPLLSQLGQLAGRSQAFGNQGISTVANHENNYYTCTAVMTASNPMFRRQLVCRLQPLIILPSLNN